MIFQYQQGRSWFHRLDPITKFVWVLCVSVISIRYEAALGQAVLLLIVLLTAIPGAGLSPQALWRALRFPFWFGLPYFALQLLFLPGEIELFRWGALSLTAEALEFAAAVSIRLLTLVAASLVFVASTDPRDIVLAMAQKLYVPYRFAFAVSIALRFVPILETEANIIRSSLRLRGMAEPKGLRSKLTWHRRFAYSVFVSAAHRVRKIAEAAENKAFGVYPDRTYRKMLAIPLTGSALMVGSGIITVWILFSY